MDDQLQLRIRLRRSSFTVPKLKCVLVLLFIHCPHISRKAVHDGDLAQPSLQRLLRAGRVRASALSLSSEHPHIPINTLQSIFPLFHPSSVDIYISFEIAPSAPFDRRFGHLLITGLILNTGYKPLQALVDEARSAKAKRSMFAETVREREEVLESIRSCSWNTATNPITVKTSCQEVITHDFNSR